MTEEEQKQQEAITRAANEATAAQNRLNQARATGREGSAEVTRALREHLEAQQAVIQAELELARIQGDVSAIQAAKDALDGLNATLEGLNKNQQEMENRLAAGRLAFDQLAGSVLTLSGPMGKLKGLMDAGADGMVGFASQAAKAVTSGDLFVSMGLKLIDVHAQFALEQEKAIANFRAQTGAGEEYNNLIRETQRAVASAGVSMDDAASATAALKNTFTDFTYLTEDMQKELTTTTALLGTMGMSFDTQASIMQTATQAMGLSATEAQAALVDVASAARSLGVDINQLGSDLQANADFLVGFGEAGVEVFTELAVQAKATGLAVNELIGIVGKFETFDEAGRHVGKLNAMLGGPFLNSIDMMNAAFEDPAAVIKQFKGALDLAGVSLENLSRPELLGFAQNLGVSVEEMAKLVGKSNEELDIHYQKQAELEEQARATQDVTQALNSAFNAMMADLGPLVDNVLKPFIEVIGSAGQAIGDFVQSTGAMRSAFTILGAGLGFGIFGFLALGQAIVAAAQAIPGLGQVSAAGFYPAALKAIGLATAGGLGGGLAGYIAGSALGGGAADGAGSPTPPGTGTLKGYQHGGIQHGVSPAVAKSQEGVAVLGESGPEMVEFGSAARVSTASTTERLTQSMEEQASTSTRLMKSLENLVTRLDKIDNGGDQPLAVYIGGDKIDEVVVKSLKSQRMRNRLGPFR